MQKGENKQSGFTIIEVSLVLAIAGLIFLMVFIALPALQRQSRDTQRRSDILTFLEMTKKYQSNNRGALPSTLAEWNEMKNTYMGDSFKDPWRKHQEVQRVGRYSHDGPHISYYKAGHV